MPRKSGTSGSEWVIAKDQVNWHPVGGLPYVTPGSAGARRGSSSGLPDPGHTTRVT